MPDIIQMAAFSSCPMTEDYLKLGVQMDRDREGREGQSPLEQVIQGKYGCYRLSLWKAIIRSSENWTVRLQMLDLDLLEQATMGRLTQSLGNGSFAILNRLSKLFEDVRSMEASEDPELKHIWSKLLLTRVEDLDAGLGHFGTSDPLRLRLSVEQKLLDKHELSIEE